MLPSLTECCGVDWLRTCLSLWPQELHLGANKLHSLSVARLSPLTSLRLLDLRDNRLQWWVGSAVCRAARTHACTCVHTYMYVHARTHTHTRTHVHLYMHARTHVHACVLMHVYTLTLTDTCTGVLARMHTLCQEFAYTYTLYACIRAHTIDREIFIVKIFSWLA